MNPCFDVIVCNIERMRGMLWNNNNTDDLWVPAKEAVGVKGCIAEFHKQNPEAPKCISAPAYAALPFLPIENFTEPTKQVLFDWTLGRTSNIGQ